MPSPVKPRATRKRPGVDAQRRAILDAAVGLFRARGAAAVPVAEICQRAGVSRDTFYRSFADKPALLEALYDSAVREHMLAVVQAADVDFADPRWLHAVVGRTIDSILQNADVAQFLYIESADPESIAYALVNEAYDRVAARMRRWCRQRHGEAPPAEYFKALLAGTQWLVHDAIIRGQGPREIARAKQAAEMLYLRAFSGFGTGE
jgi:AcrR family transcriptional regulator